MAAGWPTEKAITDFILSDQMGVMVEDVDTCSTKKDRGEVWLGLKTDEKCMEVEQRLLKGVKWLVNRAAPDDGVRPAEVGQADAPCYCGGRGQEHPQSGDGENYGEL